MSFKNEFVEILVFWCVCPSCLCSGEKLNLKADDSVELLLDPLEQTNRDTFAELICSFFNNREYRVIESFNSYMISAQSLSSVLSLGVSCVMLNFCENGRWIYLKRFCNLTVLRH